MRVLSVLAFCCALLTATSAHGGEEEDRKAAKAAFAEGTTLFDADDYAAALAKFKAAQEIRPHDKVRIPIATCLERLARFREAIAEWEVVAESESVDEHQRQEAKDAIARLTPRLATLVVNGAPAGAEVLVDDVPRCQLPCRAVVDPGEHVVIVRSDTREKEERITVTRGAEKTMEISLLEPPPDPPAPHDKALAPPVFDEPETRGPGVMTWLGIGVAVIGGAGVVGFGVLANDKHDDYLAAPSQDLLDEGRLARDLSNASIAVGAVGVALLLVDLIFVAPMTVEDSPEVSSQGLRLSF